MERILKVRTYSGNNNPRDNAIQILGNIYANGPVTFTQAGGETDLLTKIKRALLPESSAENNLLVENFQSLERHGRLDFKGAFV